MVDIGRLRRGMAEAGAGARAGAEADLALAANHLSQIEVIDRGNDLEAAAQGCGVAKADLPAKKGTVTEAARDPGTLEVGDVITQIDPQAAKSLAGEGDLNFHRTCKIL
jgi:hypothetical protein